MNLERTSLRINTRQQYIQIQPNDLIASSSVAYTTKVTKFCVDKNHASDSCVNDGTQG